MNINHQGEANNNHSLTLKAALAKSNMATRIFSNRRSIWASAFTVFSLTMFFASPGYAVAINFALVLSLANLFLGNQNIDRDNRTLDGSTAAGSMLAASLLWIASLAGSDAVSAIGALDYITSISLASVFSLVFFATLIVVENLFTIALHFLIAGKQNAPARIACLIDAKYAGFLGEIH